MAYCVRVDKFDNLDGYFISTDISNILYFIMKFHDISLKIMKGVRKNAFYTKRD